MKEFLKKEPIALVALVISAAAFVLQYLQYSEKYIAPDIVAQLSELRFTGNPILMNAKFRFAITNRSSSVIFLLSCRAAVQGASGGGGGYTSARLKCELPEDNALPASVGPGETHFFFARFSTRLDSYDEDLALSKMKIDPDILRRQIENGECMLRLSKDGYGGQQTCLIINDHEVGRIFDLELQFGNGSIATLPVLADWSQPWPWRD